MSKSLQFSTAKVNESRPRKQRKLPVGINEDIKLISIEKGETASGKSYVDFNVESDNKELAHNKRVWYPNVDNPHVKDGETQEEAAQREVNQALEHILHWMEVYLPSDKTLITANSFEEFVDQAKARIESVKAYNVAIRAKILYDREGKYTQFPNFPPYVERQVEGQATRLYVTAWEKENRMKPKEQPKSDSTLLNSSGDSADAGLDKLPF